MTIRYITSGNELRAKGLFGEGRHQLSILRNAMTFQNLKQLQRVVRFNDGTIIKCSSCFGQDTVNVFAPPYMPVVEKVPVKVEKQEYEFSFRITRDDGIVIDETLLRFYGQGINIYQKKDEYPDPTSVSELSFVGAAHGKDEDDPNDLKYWTLTGDIWNYYNNEDPGAIYEFSYNIVTQIWTVPFYEGLATEKEFFVRFICEDSVTSWYKKPSGGVPEYVYKTADLFQDEDLIKPKFYEIAVPYWKTSAYCRFDDVLWNDGDPLPFAGYGCPGWSFLSTAQRIISIETSIEFRVHYEVDRLTALFQRYHTESGPYCDGGVWKTGALSPDIPWLWGSKEAEATFSIVSTDEDGPLTLKTDTLDAYHVHPSNLGDEAEYLLDLDVTGAPVTMPFDTGERPCSPSKKDYSADYAATWINVKTDDFILVVTPQYDY